MTKTIIRPQRITPALCQAHPEDLFLFGDNLEGKGKAGQACIRGEPNAVGVPTKKAPSMLESAFLSDADLPRVKALVEAPFIRAEGFVGSQIGNIWIPADGLGTGLAELPKRAPAIYAVIQHWIERLERRFGARWAA